MHNAMQSLELPSNWRQEHLPETDSTMLQLRREEYAACAEEFVLLTADYQTCGRGQRGSSWESERGKNLLFGFLFHPLQIPADRQFSLSEALALAVRETLAEETDEVTVKWPNDIYWRDRKIAGMLWEYDLSGSAISTALTGVGINVNQTDFASNAPNPISLRQITGRMYSREEILRKLLLHFEHDYRRICAGDFSEVHTRYLRNLYRREGYHRLEDARGTFRARIQGVDAMGMLTLQREDGSTNEYAFKEVTYVHEP